MNMQFSDSVLQVASSAFDKCATFTNLFVLPLAMGKAAFANVSGASSSEYTQVLKGVVLYFVMIYAFEPVLGILLGIPEAFLPSFDLSALSKSRPDAVGEMTSMSLVPSVLMWSLESAVACLYYIAMFLNFAFAVMLASLAPIIFLMCAVLGIGLGIRTFFSLLIIVSSWPVVWAAANELHKLVVPMTDGDLGRVVFEIAITGLKIFAPLAIAYLGMASAPGRSLNTAVQSSIASGSWTMSKIGGSSPTGYGRTSGNRARALTNRQSPSPTARDRSGRPSGGYRPSNRGSQRVADRHGQASNSRDVSGQANTSITSGSHTTRVTSGKRGSPSGPSNSSHSSAVKTESSGGRQASDLSSGGKGGSAGNASHSTKTHDTTSARVKAQGRHMSQAAQTNSMPVGRSPKSEVRSDRVRIDHTIDFRNGDKT